MLDYARPQPGEAVDRAVVTVIFLRMINRPQRPAVVLPAGVTLTRERFELAEYRALYAQIGTPWLWWLRRVMPDALLTRHLASPNVALHVLRVEGEVAGFFETDSSPLAGREFELFWADAGFYRAGVRAVAAGCGHRFVFLRSVGLRAMTLNTCTADHPRALPNYLAAGFRETRRVKEIWDIPRRLGLTVPDHLRG